MPSDSQQFPLPPCTCVWRGGDPQYGPPELITMCERCLWEMAAEAGPGVVTSAPEPLPNIGDTCCGSCGPGLCYVDQVTGA